MKTEILRLPPGESWGHFQEHVAGLARLDEWRVRPDDVEVLNLVRRAASYLTTRSIPVAFPTETVYGLGADATRSDAVLGIYRAKGRPSDNPLIVHIAGLHMLRVLLTNGNSLDQDVIPNRYKPLIERFWPGPLTILLRNPTPSPLAAEVTAGLSSFGVRMPSCPLTLTLIKLAGVPLAAPSANASSKPSPTEAQHVMEDLRGRIELILDGGPCSVGVESTVVDGLCEPPVVLRPGGVSIEQLRRCPGWQHVTKAYKDYGEEDKAAPRAPGMKYKHYSPRAKVVLYESTFQQGDHGPAPSDLMREEYGGCSQGSNGRVSRRVGVIRTRRWTLGGGIPCDFSEPVTRILCEEHRERGRDKTFEMLAGKLQDQKGAVIGEIYDINLGIDVKDIAHGLFSALRQMDLYGADVIFIDGIDGTQDVAAAIMNRLRKAASEIRT